jgi:hypothetical protein
MFPFDQKGHVFSKNLLDFLQFSKARSLTCEVNLIGFHYIGSSHFFEFFYESDVCAFGEFLEALLF